MAKRKESNPPHIKAALVIIFLLSGTLLTVAVSQVRLVLTNHAATMSFPCTHTPCPTNPPPCVDSNCSNLTPAPSTKRVFVTSTTYNGNLGGLSGADAKCQLRANAAGLGGTWKSWLSDSTTSAASRLNHSTRPYKLLDGTIVANDWNDLTDGVLQHSINLTEFGNLNQNYVVWTHTTTAGEVNTTHPNYHCQNWTYSGTAAWGDEGYSTSQNSAYWTETTTNSRCDGAGSGLHALYCFEQ